MKFRPSALAVAASLVLPWAAPAFAAPTGACGSSVATPVASSYSAGGSDQGTMFSSVNATGAAAGWAGTSLTINLPLPTAPGIGQNYTLCGTTDANKAVIFAAPSLAAPSAPVPTSTNGGSLGARTEYYKITYVNAVGETVASTEASIALSANTLAVIPTPGASGNATGFNVYAATSSGGETKQNNAPIALGSSWTEPTSGLAVGSAVPSSGTATAAYLLDGDQMLGSYIVGPGNYQTAILQSDGANYRVVTGSPETRRINGAASSFPSRWVFPGGPGYAATQGDNGNVISSALTSAGITVTLPSTTKISAGWMIGLYGDSLPLTVNANGTSGGTIVLSNGARTTNYALPNATYSVIYLQFDGAAFHVIYSSASVSGAVRKVTGATSDTLLSTDGTVQWTDANRGAAATQTLPACPGSTDTLARTIADAVGLAGAYPITLTPAGGTINQGSSLILNWPYASATVQCDGTGNYNIVSNTVGTPNAVAISAPANNPDASAAVTAIALQNGNQAAQYSVSSLQSPLSRTAYGMVSGINFKSYNPSYYRQTVDAANAGLTHICQIAQMTTSGSTSATTSVTFSAAPKFPTGVYGVSGTGVSGSPTLQITRGSTSGTFSTAQTISSGVTLTLTPLGPAQVSLNGAVTGATSATFASNITMPTGTYDAGGASVTNGTTLAVANGSTSGTFSANQTLTTGTAIVFGALPCIFDLTALAYDEPYIFQAVAPGMPIYLDFGRNGAAYGQTGNASFTTYSGEMLEVDAPETVTARRISGNQFQISADTSALAAQPGQLPVRNVTVGPSSLAPGGAGYVQLNSTGGTLTTYLQGMDQGRIYWVQNLGFPTVLDPGGNGAFAGLPTARTVPVQPNQTAGVLRTSITSYVLLKYADDYIEGTLAAGGSVLPVGRYNKQQAWATDALKAADTAGTGTGAPVYWATGGSGSPCWMSYRTDACALH